MIVRLLVFLLAAAAAFAAYHAEYTNTKYAAYVIPPVVLGTLLVIFRPQIDWWWYNRFPPSVDQSTQQFLQEYMPFYQRLGDSGRARFHKRMALIRMGKDFQSRAQDEMPDDMKVIYAANQAMLTFHLDQFLLPDFEHIIVYPWEFPSPAYPEHFHASEIFVEDGVIMLSAQHMLNGFMFDEQYHNVCLHEQLNALRVCEPNWPWPSLPEEELWPPLERISKLPRKQVLDWIGRPDVEVNTVAMVYYFTYPASFQHHLPELHLQLEGIFQPKVQTA